MQYSDSTRSSCGLWEQKKTKKNFQASSWVFQTSYLFLWAFIYSRFSLCFSCRALESVFLFFFPERPCFLFPLEMAFRKASVGLTCSLLPECRWHDSPWVCTASCTHLRVTVSDRPSLCTRTPRHKFTLTDPAPGHPWKRLSKWKQFSFPLTPLPSCSLFSKIRHARTNLCISAAN